MSPASAFSASDVEAVDGIVEDRSKGNRANAQAPASQQPSPDGTLKARLSRLSMRPVSFDGVLSIPTASVKSSDQKAQDLAASPTQAQCPGQILLEQEDSSFDPLTQLDRRDLSKSSDETRRAGPLHPGACWEGKQQSGRTSYDVAVRIIDVDLSRGWAGGYMTIRNLTADMPELTTYFDAEIIGPHQKFATHKWGATEVDDLKHWSRFDAFRPLRHHLNSPDLTVKDGERRHIFLRWKERFVVPDHRLDTLPGASFDGFYYICIDYGISQRNVGDRISPSRRRSQSLSPQPDRFGPHRQTPGRAVTSRSASEGPPTMPTMHTASPTSPGRLTSPSGPTSPTFSSARLHTTYAAVVRGTDAIAESPSGETAITPSSCPTRAAGDVDACDCRPDPTPESLATPDVARKSDPPVSCHHSTSAGVGLGLGLDLKHTSKDVELSTRLAPWSNATMSGFYFHAGGQCTSYQELTLAYSPGGVAQWASGFLEKTKGGHQKEKSKPGMGPKGMGCSSFQFC